MAEKKLHTTVKTENVEQPSYEELKNYCDQLLMQRNQLGQRLQQVTNVVNKLPWLFEVLKESSFFDIEFVEKCAKEIEEIMTPPEKEESEEEKDKD